MKCNYMPFEATAAFSPNDMAYIKLSPFLKKYYEHPPQITAFKAAIDLKKNASIPREALVKGLREQYQTGRYPAAPLVKENIERLLQAHTFTVTTAHQPSLFTGPLYYIYKIVSTINLAQQLQQAYPSYHFVPVFWMGAEDHDFDEIKKAYLFDEDWVWESGESGAVGKMSTAGIAPLVEELEQALGVGPHASRILHIFRSALERQSTYGAFAVDVTHQLFQDKGLVIIDPSLACFKQLAIPIFQKELLEQPSEQLVTDTQNQLKNHGWKPQAYPRSINMFYLGDGFRQRIVQDNDGQYHVLDTDIQWSRQELIQALQQQPERFSPNVILRPLYQEYLLPNLAYIGGGGELAYWLERKSQFQSFGVPYPILMRRDSVLWIDAKSQKRMQQLQLSQEDIWLPQDALTKQLLRKSMSEEKLLTHEKEDLRQLFQHIRDKAAHIDENLSPTAIGQMTQSLKRLEQLEHKMLMAEKQKQKVMMERLTDVKSRLFPKGKLQERSSNFIPFYLQLGEEYFHALYTYLNPLDKRLKIITA